MVASLSSIGFKKVVHFVVMEKNSAHHKAQASSNPETLKLKTSSFKIFIHLVFWQIIPPNQVF
jgi:hypothetical protein